MKNSVKALLEILQGNVLYQGTTVPVIKRGYPLDKSPCITLDDSAGTVTIDNQLMSIDLPVPNTHFQHEDYPVLPQQVIRRTKDSAVNIHVWASDESERNSILKSIQELFDLVEKNNYLFCTNYENGNCKTLEGVTCKAITMNTHSRGIKEQCPNPKEYGYQGVLLRNDIKPDSFEVQDPFDTDDLTTKPITPHSVIKTNMVYYTYTPIGGKISTNVSNVIR